MHYKRDVFISFFYNPRIFVAIAKYTNSDIASTSVVINGPAITVGSNPNFFANIGKSEPIDFAAQTVTNNDKLITNAILNPTLSININFPKFTIANAIPARIAVLNSLNTTFNVSLYSMSPSDRARIIVADDCPPALPPVFINIGINAVNMI